MPGGRWLILAMFGAFVVAAIVLVGATLVGGRDSPPDGFTIFWLAAVGWNAYWWLFRIAAELRIEGSDLCWWTPLRSGRVPLAEVTEIRPWPLASNVGVFRLTTGPSVIVIATKGFRAFTDEIARIRPDLPVRLGWQARLAERLPGWNRFKRD